MSELMQGKQDIEGTWVTHPFFTHTALGNKEVCNEVRYMGLRLTEKKMWEMEMGREGRLFSIVYEIRRASLNDIKSGGVVRNNGKCWGYAMMYQCTQICNRYQWNKKVLKKCI